jgi:glycerate 2-kinase
MKVVIASDSFKGSCNSYEIASAFEKGIHTVCPDAEVVKIPVADGGEGTVQTLVSGLGGRLKTVTVKNPLGIDIPADYGIINGDTAVIEMAAASGLLLVPDNLRNPLITTTYGTGEMMRDALHSGCTKIIIGIGGSATNDGGAGMAQALGVLLTCENGKELGFGGGILSSLARIDVSGIDPLLRLCEITVLCDVSNPLCGTDGASFVYGPQKGAMPNDITLLDSNLRHFAELILRYTGKNVMDAEGAGAAGGLGAGLMAFCNATLKPGIRTILEIVNLDSHLKDADFVITGEGKIDGQSAFGKVPVGVAAYARNRGIPVFAIVGGIGDGADKVYPYGISSILSIVPGPVSLEYSLANTPQFASDAAARLMRIILQSGKIHAGRPVGTYG